MEIHSLNTGKKTQVFLDEVFVKMLTCNLFSLWRIVRIYRLFVHMTLMPFVVKYFESYF